MLDVPTSRYGSPPVSPPSPSVDPIYGGHTCSFRARRPTAPVLPPAPAARSDRRGVHPVERVTTGLSPATAGLLGRQRGLPGIRLTAHVLHSTLVRTGQGRPGDPSVARVHGGTQVPGAGRGAPSAPEVRRVGEARERMVREQVAETEEEHEVQQHGHGEQLVAVELVAGVPGPGARLDPLDVRRHVVDPRPASARRRDRPPPPTQPQRPPRRGGARAPGSALCAPLIRGPKPAPTPLPGRPGAVVDEEVYCEDLLVLPEPPL